MSKSMFPNKRQGDPLYAAEVNELIRGFRSQDGVPGSNLGKVRTHGISADIADDPFVQYVMEITSLTIDDDDTEDSGLYLGRIVRYDANEDTWAIASAEEGEEVTGDTEWQIDTNAFDMLLSVGARVVCFWHPIRTMFIPISNESSGARLFRLTGTYEGNSIGQYGDSYLLYWDSASSTWKEDTSATYRLYSFGVERWDAILNNTSTPGDYRAIVQARFDTISGLWIIIDSDQNLNRVAKCQADWRIVGTTAVVSVKICNPDSLAELGHDAFDAMIHRNWDTAYLASPAPWIWSGDYIEIGVNNGGQPFVTGATMGDHLKKIIWYSGSHTNIPKGYVLCDGTAYPADSKIGAGNSPDMRTRIIMGVDPADSYGDGSESTMGNTGGQRFQPNHQHQIRMTSITARATDDAAGFNTWDRDVGTPKTVGLEPTDEAPLVTGHLDNRQRYILEAPLIRYK